ncbi:MAG: Peptidyl-prolyl cis-trans isomerase cyp10, partial [Tremellales sp. Tagirdzhanova-0007]
MSNALRVPVSVLFFFRLNRLQETPTSSADRDLLRSSPQDSRGSFLPSNIAPRIARLRGNQNFLALAASGYYDGTIFHRNIKAFMIQGGDPNGTGKGGQSIWDRPFADEVRQTLRFNTRGIVAMANGGPDTNKSQFFITYAKQTSLDGKYSIFGKVIDGADSTLDLMEKVPVNEKSRPLVEVRLYN